MSQTFRTPVQRRAFYDYLRDRRLDYRHLVYEALGNTCTACGADGSDGNDLKIRFKNALDDLKIRHRSNPVTLHRILVLQPYLRDRVILLCHLCRLKGKHEAN